MSLSNAVFAFLVTVDLDESFLVGCREDYTSYAMTGWSGGFVGGAFFHVEGR